MKRVMIGLLLVLLSACSETTLTKQQTAGVHRIGIISAIGDELSIRSFMPGGTRPDGLLDRGPVSDMALDAYVIDQTAAKLKDHYQIVPVAYQPANFHQTEEEQSLHAGFVQGRPIGQIIRGTTQLPSGMTTGTEMGVDLYLVFLTGQAMLQSDDQSLSGTSLSQLPADDGSPFYNLGVVYWISIVDGHTLQPLGNVNTLSDHGVDPRLWASSIAALTPEQKRQLAPIWQKRIDLTLEAALRKLNLLMD
jgi:hypothetical protein